MSKDTDYKRLWRKSQDDNADLLKLMEILNGQLEAQRDVLMKIRDGEIKVEDVIQYMPKDVRKDVAKIVTKI